MVDAVITQLRSIVGTEHVLVDADLRAGHETDWTGRYSGTALAVVRPASTEEVAAVLQYCNEQRVAIVTQGGNTGLVGGGVPRSGGAPAVVLSTRRLDDLGPVATAAQQVTADAGVTLARWRDHARRAGLDAPLDFAARDSATIGGAIATNAGGSRVVRFGTMRRQVAGVEVVLADGTVVGSTTGLPKETAGLHWPSVITGSEGTLGVVTSARLRLVPRYAAIVTAMVTTDSLDGAVSLLARLRAEVASLDSAEMLLPAAVDLVADHLGAAPPVPWAACTLLVECAAHHDPTDELATVLAAAPEVVDTAMTTDPARRADLLRFRDRVTEAISVAASRLGVPVFKLDVAVPPASLGRLLDVAESAAAADGATLVPFGHLAEGNLHLNHLGASDPERIARTVLPAVADLGGTISAEHGIGVAKVPWLGLIRSRDDLAAQHAIAQALDPAGIMNPGVLRAP
ncbi:MAG: FAD-binding oxidoreductase [Ilumatobacteraceae bacterium]